MADQCIDVNVGEIRDLMEMKDQFPAGDPALEKIDELIQIEMLADPTICHCKKTYRIGYVEARAHQVASERAHASVDKMAHDSAAVALGLVLSDIFNEQPKSDLVSTMPGFGRVQIFYREDK